MSNEFKWFRDINTGKTAKFPAGFADRFDTLEEIPSSDAGCLDCVVAAKPDTDVTPEALIEDTFEPDEGYYDQTEDDD